MTYADEIEQLARSIAQVMTDEGAAEEPTFADALAARDAIVSRLRVLTEALVDVGPRAPEYPARLVASDPVLALREALRDLAPASGAEQPSVSEVLSRVEGPWHNALRSTVVLEGYTEAVRHLDGPAAWGATRDVADLASVLHHVDADLARRAPNEPAPESGHDRTLRVLTDVGTHGAVRIAAEELRATVPVNADNSRDVTPPAGPPQPMHVARLTDLPEAMRHLTTLLEARGSGLTAIETRAVATTLAEGLDVAASATRAASAHDGRYAEASESLRAAEPTVRRIYAAAIETLTTPSAAVTQLAGEIRDQLRTLSDLQARVQAAVPSSQYNDAMVKVAAPALAWAAEAPATAAALDTAMRSAQNAGRILAPPRRERVVNGVALEWVRSVSPAAGRDEPLAVSLTRDARDALETTAAPIQRLVPSPAPDEKPSPVHRANEALSALAAVTDARGRRAPPGDLPAHPRDRPASTRKPTDEPEDDRRRRSSTPPGPSRPAPRY